MKNKRFFRVILCLSLMLLFLTVTVPGYAVCRVTDVSATNAFANSDSGTAADDLILCRSGSEPVGTVEGLQGDDTILVYFDTGPLRDIRGGGVPVPGNDTIIVYEGVSVSVISGDYDTTGGNNSGDDQITLYGTALHIRGDDITSDSTTDVGGDDVIDVYGTVTESVAGDGIMPSNALEDQGGDDIITIRKGAVVENNVFGDVQRSSNASSRGGDDIITIAGTVGNDVFGDFMNAGTGGADTIVVTKTGRIGSSGTTHHVYGDYNSASGTVTEGGSDDILIEGVVYGSIIGDHMEDRGGFDDIFIGSGAIVTGHVYGDYLLDDAALNLGDKLVIAGRVEGNVEGDGLRGNGADDYITVERGGEVHGRIDGDGTNNLVGVANGGKDIIIVKGLVRESIFGDNVDGDGATDNITVMARDAEDFTDGIVRGDIVGDEALGNGGNDIIRVNHRSRVEGYIYGDNESRTGGNGGDDNIQIDGWVGRAVAPTGVIGDKVDGDGGDDFIHVELNGWVHGPVVGDDVNGKGGEDLIWIDGTVSKRVVGDSASGGNAKDQIAIRQTGRVLTTVVGDGTSSNKNGGWDVINIIGGEVTDHVKGDEVGGSGGNDFMAIRMNGSVGRNFIGDDADVDGGNDTLSLINGTVGQNIIGDDVGGDGGNDKINILVAGTVQGDVIGDNVGVNKLGGNDSIFVAGTIDGRIYGDHSSKNAFAGADNIQTNPSSVIGNGIYGDNAKGVGKNDTIKVNGKINSGGIRGDVVFGKGGNDNISIFGFGDVTGNVIGDDANAAGGNDTIQVSRGGKVTGNVWGDFSKNKGGKDIITIAGTVTGNVEGDHHKSGSTASGGDDTIVIENGALVQGSVFGDNSPGNGGDDKIDIKGTVNGNVLGDNVGGAGGNDVIRIFASGVVGGNVCGKNNCTSNPGDNVVFLDENADPDFSSADTIIIAGKVLGNVIAGATFGNSDDTVVVVEGAEIGGTVYAGDETDGDSFIYIENIVNEEKTVSEVVNSVTEKDGKVTVNGVTYTLDDVETVSGAVGQIACFGMDYRMNKASDGCAARSGAEKDAIQWHQDNPGNDGRLPGLEGCAVYPYGDALRVYEIMDGTQGQLVAEIWGDVLSDAPAANELLGETTDGNITLYHLASGELQIECRNSVDGKTQVRVLGDLAGAVTNAYDKG